MKLNEYLAKNILEEEGIPVPRGFVSRHPEQILGKYKSIGFPLVLKAQIPIASRKKMGGIFFVKDLAELKKYAFEIFSKNIAGYSIKEVLVEEMIDIKKEVYLSFTIDRGERKYIFMASGMGGINIEDIAREKPSSIMKIYIDPLIGLLEYQVRKALKILNISSYLRKNVKDIIVKTYNIFIKYDCELIEINPLAISSEDKVYAVDAKIILDENALYRHKDIMEMAGHIPKEYSYIELDGDIGIMGNGAGLTMATMDIVKYFGGKPANFLDIGGGASVKCVKNALKMLLNKNNVKTILINILGGITRCDEVARGIIEAVDESDVEKPVIVRLMGTNEAEGIKILLSRKNIVIVNNMEEAARKAVKISKMNGNVHIN